MPLRRPSLLLRGLLAAALPSTLAACDDGSAEHEHDDHGHDDHGHAPELDAYEAGGITKASDDGLFMVRLVSSPEPPAKGLNTWTLEVMRHDDMAMIEQAVITVEPWMPAHEHGSDSEATVEDMGQGMYVADPVELQMRGTWDTTITIEHEDMTDEVHFVFAVE